MRRNQLIKCKGLILFHKAMARHLKVAKQVGNIQTAKTYAACLKVNAQVLRNKLLFAHDGTRL